MDFKTLYNLYIINELSTVDIGKIFKKHPTTIRWNLRKYSIPLRNRGNMTKLRIAKISQKLSGSNNHRWTGGIKILKGGYVGIYKPEHPYCNSQKYVPEHRIVMENHLHRYLLPNEIVHHIDGNNKNNDISNLELMMNQSEHAKSHYKSRYKNSKGQFMS